MLISCPNPTTDNQNNQVLPFRSAHLCLKSTSSVLFRAAAGAALTFSTDAAGLTGAQESNPRPPHRAAAAANHSATARPRSQERLIYTGSFFPTALERVATLNPGTFIISKPQNHEALSWKLCTTAGGEARSRPGLGSNGADSRETKRFERFYIFIRHEAPESELRGAVTAAPGLTDRGGGGAHLRQQTLNQPLTLYQG